MHKNNQPRRDAHEFAARLGAALDRVEGCPKGRGRATWLAARYSVSQPTASGWLNGDHLPTPERVRDIARLATVSYDWLYFGVGAMSDLNERDVDGVLAQLPAHSMTPVEPPPTAAAGAAGASDSVRRETLSIALRLAAEALGDDLEVTPAQHAELVLILCDLLTDGLPSAKVLQFARRTASAIVGGSDGAGAGGAHHAIEGNSR